MRDMDDLVVLTPTRWALRRAVRLVHATLRDLRLSVQPDKTFIGRIERGFDFLGCHLTRSGVTVARATVDRFVGTARRLHEQTPGDATARVDAYTRRWVGWATAQLAAR